MPVTPAHLVVAVPAWRRRRWWAAALAAGTLAPDLARFTMVGADEEHRLRDLTHTLAAAVTLDVVLGLLVLVVGVALVWPTVLAFAPDAVVVRVDPPPARPVGAALIAGSAAAVAAGALMHVVLDGVTHLRLGLWEVPIFEHMTGGRIVQYTLSSLGVGWLCWELVRFARRPRRQVVRSVGFVGRSAVHALLVAVGVAAACDRLTEFASPREGIRLYGTMAFQGTVRAVSVLAVVVVVGSVIRVVAQARRGVRDRHHAEARPDRVGAAR